MILMRRIFLSLLRSYRNLTSFLPGNIPKMTSTEEETSNFVIDRNAFTIIKEGKVEVLFPNTQDVFYNPVQEFNRDLSVAVLRRFAKEQKEKNDDGITILEALSASGLRSIRYALEIPNVKRIVANDVSIQAIESIRRNVKYNRVCNLVEISHNDAAMVMYESREHEKRFHVVDLDPYGSPTPFLDAGVQSVRNGGLLLVTCTDVAILCGNCSEKCHANYGAMSLKAKFSHEMALRIVLQSIESHANRYGRYIVPLLSVSIDFYVRIFVRVFSGHAEVKHSASKLAMVYMCTGCETFAMQPIGKRILNETKKNYKFSNATGPVIEAHCKHCGHPHHLGGPIWTEPIHDRAFVEGVLDDMEANLSDLNTLERIQGILTLAKEELPDIPLFYTLDKLSSIVHTRCPKMNQFRSALLNAGYRVSYSHTSPQSIKTDAPSDFIWDVMRHWEKLNPITRQLADQEPAKAILDKKPNSEVSFELHPDSDPESKKNRLLRYQMNPEKFWGPKSRAKTSLLHSTQETKSNRLQGKRSNKDPTMNTNLKRFPCKRFKKGECNLGDDCKYLHLEESAEPISEIKNKSLEVFVKEEK